MKTRQEAISYGLTFENTYLDTPFKDPNWQLIRIKGSRKAFLWIYEKDGVINLNVKVDPQWRDFWGRIAEMAGEPKMARAVGNALHKNPDPENIPCFRVVNSKGELSGAFAFGGENEQAKRLMEDGVEVVEGKVDLEKYGI